MRGYMCVRVCVRVLGVCACVYARAYVHVVLCYVCMQVPVQARLDIRG
jgi:hypothetical protein